MKFSFVNVSPNEDLSLREKRKAIASWPPLGVLYLATILNEKGLEVSVLDQPAKGFTVGETAKWVEKEDPDILGFSTFASSGRTAALISNEVKKRDPDLIVVFGNYYATFNSERVLRKYPSVDLIVRGEGENTIVDLANYLRKEEKLQEIPGITFRKGKNIVSTPERPLIKDLDSLPFPDRSLSDIKYQSMIAGAKVATKKFTSIVSSRGCVYNCRFCSCQRFAQNRWRPRSVQNTLEELHLLASEGYEQLIFVDDCFTLNQKRVINLCRRIRKEKIQFEWTCEGRVDSCSSELFRELAKAGCKLIYFGIESANQRILNYYEKKTTPYQSRKAVEKARKAGIDVIIGSFILGAPDETREEIQNTIKFAEQIAIDFPQFNILGVYPGTEIWNEMQKRGLLDSEDYWETGAAVSQICPGAVPYHEIEQTVHDAFYHFIRRPKFLIKQMTRMMKSPYRMNIVVNNLNRIGDIRENIQHVT